MRNYYSNEPKRGAEGNINYSIKESESFNYKTSIIGKLQNNGNGLENIKIVVSLKYLGNFWKALNMPLINCEVSLDLKWSKNCVLTSKATREADPDSDSSVLEINNPTDAQFIITDCKLYVPVATLSS